MSEPTPIVETILNIDSLTLNHDSATAEEAVRTIYRTDQDRVEIDGGHDAGVVTVRISADGEFDLVAANLGQTGDLDGLNRAIVALAAVRDQLEQLYAGRGAHGGRCLAEDDWGRFRWGSTHQSSEHDFPTEADRISLGPIQVGQVAS